MGRGLVGSDAGVPALGEIGAKETRGAARAPDGGDGAGASHDEQHRQRGEERTAAREEHLERYLRAPSTVARHGDPSGFPLIAGPRPRSLVDRRSKNFYASRRDTKRHSYLRPRLPRLGPRACRPRETCARDAYNRRDDRRVLSRRAKCAARLCPLPLLPYHIPRSSSPAPRWHSCSRTRSVSVRRAHAPPSRARMRTPPRFPRAKSSRTVE